jgi:hypothetical protein
MMIYVMRTAFRSLTLTYQRVLGRCILCKNNSGDKLKNEIEATKKDEKETFDKSLQEIERYLNNGDWTLAESSVHRVMKEYDDFIRREWISQEKEASTEEVKNVEQKKD